MIQGPNDDELPQPYTSDSSYENANHSDSDTPVMPSDVPRHAAVGGMVGAVVSQMIYGNRKIIHARRRTLAQRSARDEG
jgi:hypothetical protein